MTAITVENRIEHEYGCSIVDFFQQCVDDGMDTADIAEMINCSVSNLRRIARKYKFTFFQPDPVKMYSEDEHFLNNKINVHNFLSRRWLSNEGEVIH
ncbi:MAG: hypothetical protein EP298_06360 [Gammaproteobacteria bacterium]|nr:MAG: hypothetical protein EP298_06360 [Gammaproteobacteria bacterium]UTW43272.1 hypothetical protein KFE69_03780 [bacterium SCSIO 12844]